MLTDIAPLLCRSAGHFIDEVAGAHGVKCIAHSMELLKVKVGIKPRAQKLRGDTFTLSTILPPQNLEQTHGLPEAPRNMSLWEGNFVSLGPHCIPRSLPGTQREPYSSCDFDTPSGAYSGHSGIKEEKSPLLLPALVTHFLSEALACM